MTKQWVNRALALILVATIFIIGGATLLTNLRSFGYAALVTYTQYLDAGANLFDNIGARVKSLTSAINTGMIEKQAFQKANARMQLMLGKEMLSFGGTMMVWLKTGQLYDVQAGADVTRDVGTMAKLHERLTAQGIPMLFVYAHSELYEDGMLPAGIEDENNQVADDIVNGLRAAGIETIDSRALYREQGMTLQDAAMNTDQHWAPPMAFAAAGAAVKALNATGRISLDTRLIKPELFDVAVVENGHLGDVGARVGAGMIEPDDFAIITPKYDTAIDSRIRDGKGFSERSGTFSESVLNMNVLDGALPHNIYDVYGYHRDIVYYTNPDAPEGRLLVVKDSFGTPTASFMALAAREVCAIDLRRTQLTVEQMVDEFKPDAVLVVHCQEMMRGNKNYVFVN